MSTEVAVRQAPSIEESFRVAKGFAMSGYFADAKSAEQAFVKIMAGAEMGLSPFQAMTGIHIIKGKPVVGAGLLAAMIDLHPDYDYHTTWKPDQANAESCTVTIFKNGEARGASTFSMTDAKQAELGGDQWKKYPPNMLFARAMSNAVRWYAPGVTGQATYTDANEIEADVVPPHIEALDRPADALVTLARDILDATEVVDLEDVPFTTATAAPAASTPAESPDGQPAARAAEPAATTPTPAGGGLCINSIDDAARVIRAMSAPQLEALKVLLEIEGQTTKTALAARLFDQREGWFAEDIYKEMGA